MPDKPTLCHVHFSPDDRAAEVERGETVLAAAQKAGIYISSLCGGDGICGKCRVILRSGEIHSKPTTLLGRDEIRKNYILACQSTVQGDLEIEIPPETRLEEGQILGDEDAERFGMLSLVEGAGFPLNPVVRKYHLKLEPPSLESPLAGHERLYQAILAHEPGANLQTGFAVLRDFNRILTQTGYEVTATIGRRGATTEVVQVEPGDTSASNLGLAIDIGTTTLVVQLVDLVGAKIVDSEAKYNSQMKHGEDYIRRIMYAEQHNALDDMRRLIVSDLNELIEILVRRNSIRLSDVTCAVVAGNTAMIHFFIGLDPTGIRKEPYVPVANSIPPLRAAQVGLHINPRGILYTLPSVAAYVGADITGGAVAIRLDEQKDLCLFIDVGTNGEVVLGNRDWMVCCSASAGPAFEGAGVEYGMRAARGAIEKVRITPDCGVLVQTIGNRPPRGICGSGLLDLLAAMFRAGILGRDGRFQPTCPAKRLVERDGNYEFIVVPKAQSAVADDIVITQADVSNLIRSKAAIYAAISTLVKSVGVKTDDVRHIYLAGGFGNYLDVRNAITLGMLPDVPPERIHFVGNTAVAGARAALLSEEALARIENVARMMTYIDLMTNPKYMEEFVSANFIPHTDIERFPSVSGPRPSGAEAV
ncbi:MAG TPA: ASKHA domain-containing protein [Planctomycetota bacterium]|nr:ASKHA domain-containing protein [Planctomycetota bacterium]